MPGAPNFANRTLFHGDNLDFLRGMNSETVHLIATDPPFNKGKDFHATPDSVAAGARFHDRWSWEKDIHEEWVDQIKDDYPAVWEVVDMANVTWGNDMGAFLCYMGVRLMAMHRVLRPDGSLYLHCDPTASHYLKAMLDAIFGVKNFRNDLAWCYTGPSNTKRWFPRKHDNILFYVKSDAAPFNGEDVRIPYKEQSFTMGGGGSLATKNRVGDYRTGAAEQLAKGKIVEDYWTDVPSLSVSKERIGYPTQKPLALYERIIRASSKRGDLVLDPFCGCATTPVAAERLDRRWVGMDIWERAHDLVIARLVDEGLAGPGGESDRLLTKGDITYTKEPPIRTDEGEVAAPHLQPVARRERARWERLSHREISAILAEAQGDVEGVVCAGCGRKLEREFMQLDHITPRSDRGANDITNRILLCQPCNGRKANRFTLSGLMRENRKIGWMRDEPVAKIAQDAARRQAERVRDEMS